MIQSKLAAIDLEELSDIESEGTSLLFLNTIDCFLFFTGWTNRLICETTEGEEKRETSASYLPTMKSVDLRHAYSTFQSLRKVPLPYDWESKDGYGLTKEMWSIIQHSPLW